MIATIDATGVTAPWLLEGAMNAEAFNTYVTHVLCPTLQAGDIVVMDNLSSHKQAAVTLAIEARGAQVIYLPPYSPDLNPIELCWSKVKQALRAAKAKTLEALMDALSAALRSVSVEDILHWMRHCGYALL
jgi:transposase